MRHNYANQDCYEDPDEDKEQSNIVDHGQGSIGEKHCTATNPSDYEITNEDMPPLHNIIWVVQAIHCDSNLTANASHGCYTMLAETQSASISFKAYQ
jgi:hypothetical protein